MDSHRYVIKQSFFIPLCLTASLLVILLGLSLYYGASFTELIVLIIILCASTAMVLECCCRSIIVESKGLIIKKFLRTGEISWDSIHQVGMMIFRRKCYLIMTTDHGFHIFSSSYGNFANLVQNVIDHVSSEFVDEAVQKYVEAPVEGRGDVYSVYFAVISALVLITMKLLRII